MVIIDNEVDFESLLLYVCQIVSKRTGNILDEAQHSTVSSRLKKRVLDLKLDSYTEYSSYLKRNLEQEVKHLISLLTTHHTFFFREFYHFEYMLENIQLIINNAYERGESKIRIYSAACSRGQEAYSLAMFMNVILSKIDPAMDFEIIGTDIDEECIDHAKRGVYNYNEIKKIPEQFLEGHFERGRGDLSNYVRIKKELKSKCHFYPANLFDVEHIEGEFDIIFCRNVFIYFKQEEIFKVVDVFRRHLYETGFFVTGLCESLKPLNLPDINHRGICVYGFNQEVKNIPSRVYFNLHKPIRLMIVDDSKSIQKILVKIFDKDPDFKVVAIANDGLEAEKLLKIHKVDAMTLDIHMPNKNGVDYLKDNFRPQHPNVIIISSANREDAEFSAKAIEFGASDFVEKPALNNMAQKAQEIKNKIKISFFNIANSKSIIHKSFERKVQIVKPESKARVLLCSKSSDFKLEHFIQEMGNNEPPCVILYEGNESLLASFSQKLSKRTGKKISLFETSLSSNHLYLADAEKFLTDEKERFKQLKTSLCVFGTCSEFIESKVLSFGKTQLLIEDIDGVENGLSSSADDIFPYTSFYFMSTQYLGDKT